MSEAARVASRELLFCRLCEGSAGMTLPEIKRHARLHSPREFVVWMLRYGSPKPEARRAGRCAFAELFPPRMR